ncbi:MAG: gamma-glutamyl-gamma-aminobutyrate hydrolase family protein [Actinomycetota bacterium]|nr:gamma-glutamyl-gamma-aminobutyrate hydrolase family protein [Actinomycetota bacterium]
MPAAEVDSLAPSRPIVLVTGRRLALGRVERWLEPAVASPSYYVEAISRAGGVGPVLGPEPVDHASAVALVERFDGLLLTGGVDVDPVRYGQERAPQTYGCDDLLDEFELRLLHAAIGLGRPVLAICRGVQVLNVAFGGTLDQHITDRPGLVSHGLPNGGGASDVTMVVEPGSRLAEALGTNVPDAGTGATGRCHHHQAVDRVGEGLVVSARASDGVIEGLERTGDPWVVGVQWHPEDSADRDSQQQALFDRFIVECHL